MVNQSSEPGDPCERAFTDKLSPIVGALALAAALTGAAAAQGALRGRLVPVSANANLENTLVWIDGGEALPPVPRSGAKRVMSQVNKAFSPPALAVRTDDSVSFENLDGIFHNVFSLDKANPFDLGLFKGKKHFASDGKTELAAPSTAQSFKRPGKFLVFCNIHPDMVGAIHVFSHGYYGQSDKNGLFTLPSPPPGKHAFVIDGPTLERPLRREIDVKPGTPLIEIQLAAHAKPVRVRHTRKDGQPYDRDRTLEYQ